MNMHLENIKKLLQDVHLSESEKESLLQAVADADKQWSITDFKLDRTEKVKKTTAILLEETIEELEQKRKAVEAQNRELEIETSLERVRTVAMGMKKAGDLLKICEVLFKELDTLGFAELRNAMINIYNDEKQTIRNYDYSNKAGKTVTEVPYNFHPLVQKQVTVTKTAPDAFVEFSFAGEELKLFRELRKNNGEQDDPQLEITNTLHYYFYSIGDGSIGISTYSAINEQKLELLKRFRNVFELAYKRYVDISNAEAQAREAQIETGLERVRSRSLAMHNTSELQEVIHTVHTELLHLNIAINGGSFIAINSDIKTRLRCWGSGGTANTSEEVALPLYEKPFCSNLIDHIKKGPAFFTEEYTQAEKKEFFTFLFQYEPWSKLSAAQQQETLSSPGGYTRSCNVSEHTTIFIINHFGEKFSSADNDILKRFGKVFEQTYTRFLDLQKAEAQAREAEIELALERVRARTMAMQHSDELADASFLLDSQVRALGIETRGCAFNIYNENDATEWFSSAMGTMPTYQTPREKLFLRYYEEGVKGKSIHIETFAGEECAAHYDYLCTLPVMGDALKKLKESGGSFPVQQVDHVVYFKYGYLLFITLDPVPGAHDIFIRFAKVFEQTYTRFLDLQKAEAQARESKIEAALERVRAASMAMHKSADLLEVIKTVTDQLVYLEIDFEGSNFVTVNPGKSWLMWICTREEKFPFLMEIPYFNHREFIDYDAAKNEGRDFYTYVLSPEENAQWMQHFFEKATPRTALPDMTNERREQLLQSNSQAASIALFDKIVFAVFRITNQPFNESENNIFKRIGKVFEQAYTRFLDLQKAEAQAKEAQVETALERVRARTMGMQKSEELKEVIQVVFEQFNQLNICIEHTGFIIDYKQRDDMHIWLADMYASPFEIVIPYFDSPHWNSFIKAKKNSENFFANLLNFEEKNKFYKDLFKLIPPLPEDAQLAIFNKPGVAISTVLLDDVGLYIENFSCIPFTEEENTTLMRFGKVFQQTYTRFLDLQKAEAQAREAKINLAVERVRARALSMFKSEEIIEVVAKLKEEVMTLNIPDVIAATIFLKEGDDHVRMWDLSSLEKDNNGYQLPFDITFTLNKTDPFLYVKRVWENPTNYFLELQETKDFERYVAWLRENNKIEVAHEIEEYIEATQLKRLHHAVKKLNSGKIAIDLLNTPPDEMESILTKMGAAFDLAYTRFLDLQKAEAQALQAAQDLVAIKIARQKAEEALTELQATQKQLIQSEKMASLGELTAGIAHEIQNPLNFVNNFSEVSKELLDEMREAIEKGDMEEAKDIMNDVVQNLEKINHHGKRADGIVKGMLQHSRSNNGTKEATDINKLADEYLRLAYHGLRAKDNSFNALLKTNFDETLFAGEAGIGNIHIIPQDIGRVLLNLITNAFYAVSEKLSVLQVQDAALYEPTVTITTKRSGDKVLINVKDNGNGIPKNIIDKIFQPFFTTKPTGQGTGLGLSLAYDIVKAHGGELKAETKEGEGTIFIIQLPIA